ncbi:hypothetical protein HK096_009566, partial [Nowakowskiella sp. JEL0078]
GLAMLAAACLTKINQKTAAQLAIKRFFEIEVEGKKICKEYTKDQSFNVMEVLGENKEKAESFIAIPAKFIKDG